ncbi:nicotinate-nucleotide--dimethylbenzimidazole phosphoribosyltransferase [Desulfovibrio litoralis]|uniref:Nicotinate-nucleotide--dimethylbenzimidazole phosphoribosyltransferase n=1 Tax=Desulfovibrio litoralis DSM 11393 TaxID=1121455 RepID=A0A1M7RRN3_9BACT|nr:nicotinate-nucleotide--dimethylbenzimidazole phosphoribosyltransferase [Desulfovibrio litoralis]SHN48728.1 nicotinate-nucleotide-dimethylbenzimidazole phosphoribosyltransferase [Desulfovibrio litoralis DSM 11393]
MHTEEQLNIKINNIIKNIKKIDTSLYSLAQAHLDSLAKPLGSLGQLEEIAARIFCIQAGQDESPKKMPKISVDPACIYTIAAAHGVSAEGVAVHPDVVNNVMVKNFLQGGAGINVFCNTAGVEQFVVDAGCTGAEFEKHPRLLSERIANGTKNLAKEAAMSRFECLKALELGIRLAEKAKNAGYKAVGTGEMGIGNTTPSTALFAAFTGLEVEKFVGAGAGLDQAGIKHKKNVITNALKLHKKVVDGQDPIEILATLGGFEIAALAGLCLGAVYYNLVLVIDGFISSAAFLTAYKLNPDVLDYAFFSHLSAEQGHIAFLTTLKQKPILDLQLRLGEGTGAALAIFLLRAACNIFNDMATLESLNVLLE